MLLSVIVGESPKGSVVPLEIVSIRSLCNPCPSLSITTLLKVTPEASIVATVAVSKVTVPLLCVQVGEPDSVKLSDTVIVLLVLVKAPAEIV